jgi:hypothetical protein
VPDWYGTELWGPNLEPTPVDGVLALALVIFLLIFLLSGFKNEKDEEQK